MINHISNESLDLIEADNVVIGLFSPGMSTETTGRVLAGEVDYQITLSVRSISTDYGVVAVLDKETALAIGKQLIKVAVGTGEH